jgi:SAM-dependent methyltransferase
MTLGAHDPFRHVAVWDAVTAEEWVEALDRRAAGVDQVRLRAGLLAAAALRPGDTVVEVGCGTGVLLAELASAVGPGGRVVGIEPQPAFAEAARDRLATLGLAGRAEVRTVSAEKLPLADASAAACVAQTVLIHLPGAALTGVLEQMCRVVRPGGRVVSLDQDGDTWVIDHPDRALTRRIIRFNSDERYADGWTGRRLPRLLGAAGLADVTLTVWPHVDTEVGSYLHGMALRLADAAVEAGVLTGGEHARWVAGLDSLGSFLSSINYCLCAGTRM